MRMNDLVSRRDALDAICDNCDTVQAVCAHFPCKRYIAFEKLPAVEDRPRGRWIRHPEQKNIYGGKFVECSECGEKYLVQYIEDEKYCRNCGAEMEG